MLNSASTIETLLNHRSIRKYTGESISDEALTTILEAGRAVSTSSFLQATSIIRVIDTNKRTALRQISCDMSEDEYTQALAEGKRLGHGYVESCAEYLVFCMDAHRHNQLADVQTDWMEVTLIGAIDAALMAQNILAAAESLGLGGVYIGSLRNDIERAGEILGLPKHVVPLFGLCLGHPDWESKINQSQRPRLPLQTLVSTDTYQIASDDVLATYNEQVREYYQGRGLDLDWKAQIAATFGGEVRPFMLDYLQKQGFAKR
ncbi:oxygen-insensitive NADPH nitroreductase [Moraxella haemolytica]|uniref:oxygen-insensitive NADPH nitroreductase n=1 Tax=Moraxella haemolytica TaxID=2904119 RepID=UPI0025437C8C|nr:oxygen-insensitive NADPH nitroreductase [Moraxella sp. ZY171148]WII95383.1 oxygen-insensitive NADPH nitroreductase [Moraxella sp. ZY171148]